MTKLLIRLFIRDAANTQSSIVRAAYGKLASFVGIICNLLLFAGKLTVGLLCGSISIMADAVNNLSDASSSIISLLGFKLAAKPADADHPYGHARYEYISGLMVAVFILFIGVELLKSSIDKIISPSPVAFSWITVAVLCASILVKLWMSLFNHKIGKTIGSKTLIATATDSRNDVIATVAVLAAMLLSHYTDLELDGYVGIAVALFILYSGVMLIRETLDPILGRAPDPDLVKQIRAHIESYDDVLGTHDLMVHDYGPGHQFASVHAEVAAEADVLAMHDLIDNIEREIAGEFGVHTIIHMDPIVTADARVEQIRLALSEKIHAIDPALSIHDLRMVPGTTHTNLVFDCVIPYGYKTDKAALRETIDAAAKELDPSFCCVVTIEHSFTTET